MLELEAIKYVDQTGVQQVIEPREMGLKKRVRTGILLFAARLYADFAFYSDHNLANTYKTMAWLYSCYPKEKVDMLLRFVQAHTPHVRSTGEIQIARDLAGRSCNDSLIPEPHVIPAFTIMSSRNQVLGNLFSHCVSVPVSP